MRLLLDECMPRRLKRDLVGYDVSTVEDAEFKGLKNGQLLKAASGRFDVLLTVYRKLVRQHRIGNFNIGVIILVAFSNRYDDLRQMLPKIIETLTKINPGDAIEISSRT